MIVPLIGVEAPPKTNEVTAAEIQGLIDFAELAPKLDVWLFCEKCKSPLEGANGFSDPVWTLRCRCTTHRYQRRPISVCVWRGPAVSETEWPRDLPALRATRDAPRAEGTTRVAT